MTTVGTLYSSAARTTALDSIGGNSFDSTIPGLLQQAIVAVGNNGGGGGGGSVAWGAITGTLSNQTDLQAALDLKAPIASPTFTGSVAVVGPTWESYLSSVEVAWSDGTWITRLQAPSSLVSNVTWVLPSASGTLIGSGDAGTVTSAMLAGSIAPSKITGTAAILGANTFTALQQFTGTTHAGLRLNNLTTAERDAIASPQAGMCIWNTTAARLQLHNGSAWTAGMVRLDGDTMTGTLVLPAGSASTPSLTLGDSTTGIYRVTTNAISIASSGAERFRVQATMVNSFVDFNISSGVSISSNSDTFLGRRSAAWWGLGIASATPIGQTFSGCDGSGTNITGGILNISAGRGTGTGIAGVLNFRSHAAAASGSTVNATPVNVLSIIRPGVIRITGIPTSSAGLSAGDVYSNAGVLTIV